MMAIQILIHQPIWWIQFILTIVMVLLAIFQFVKLYVNKVSTIKRTNIDLIIILGVTIAILGIAGQIWGMILSLEAIITAKDISPMIVSEGFKMSFYTTIFGLFVLLFSGIFWYVNKTKWEINRS